MLLTLSLIAALLPQSAAAEPVPTLELTLVDPGGQETELAVPLPWEARYTFPTDKLDFELAISAELDEDGKVAVAGVVSEVKKGKARPLSSKKAALKEGRKGDFKSNFAAPKGMKDDAGNAVTSLHWSFEGMWMLNGEGAAMDAPPTLEGEYVVVWPSALLFVAPEEDAASFRLSVEPRLVTEGPPVPFRLVGEREGWLELESVSGNLRSHCGAPHPALRDTGLTVYTRPESLSQVLTRQVTASADGGGYTLNPGVPVQCDASGRCALLSRGFGAEIQAVLSLPADAVGDRYTPAESLGPRSGIRALKPRTSSATLATMGDDEVETTSSAVPIQALSGAWEPIATVGNDCARYDLPVLPSQIVDQSAGGLSGLVGATGTMSSVGDLPTVPEGAALYWADGAEAGATSGEKVLLGETTEVGGRTCWALGLDAGDQPPVVLCADSSVME